VFLAGEFIRRFPHAGISGGNSKAPPFIGGADKPRVSTRGCLAAAVMRRNVKKSLTPTTAIIILPL